MRRLRIPFIYLLVIVGSVAIGDGVARSRIKPIPNHSSIIVRVSKGVYECRVNSKGLQVRGLGCVKVSN